MCYYYSQADEAVKIQQRFQAKLREGRTFKPTNKAAGFSFPEMPIIINENALILDVFSWGLIPRWAKDIEFAYKIRKNTLNARSESIFTKPSFKNAINQKRCLIPTNGFYEWKHEGKSKIPYFIALNDSSIFAFGGIYDEWLNKDTGEIINTFSIITTPANPLMEEIHNTKKRMPLILPKESESIWLNQELNNYEITDLLLPYDENNMKTKRIEQI
ncbi:MAG: hypothetical protein A2X64_06800 [Ignavibacteria bacterium GWF2_33_9]|nr:MAG: hypothetical protein A2X64_06800 [Ignavibacteria bacterium GWF2_33_9]